MLNLIVGFLLGSVLTTAVGIAAGKDSDPLGIGRDEQQRKYDYYRQRQQYLDIEQLRRNSDQERMERERKHANKPC